MSLRPHMALHHRHSTDPISWNGRPQNLQTAKVWQAITAYQANYSKHILIYPKVLFILMLHMSLKPNDLTENQESQMQS